MKNMFGKRRHPAATPVGANGADAIVNPFDNTLIDALAPSHVYVDQPDCVMLSNSEWMRFWYVRDWPTTLSREGWLRLLRFPANVRVSIHLEPVAPGAIARQLRGQITALRASRHLRAKQMRDPSITEDETIQSAEDMARRAEAANEPVYFIVGAIALTASSKALLDSLSIEVERVCQNAQLVVDRALGEQLDGMHAVLPEAGWHFRQHERNATIDTLVNLMPALPEEAVMPEGVFFGVDQRNGTLAVLDPFKFVNGNMIIVGQPGVGKSFWTKDHIEQCLGAGYRVYVIDIEDEYRQMCADMGGRYIDMRLSGENKINVMDFDPHDPDGFAGNRAALAGFLSAVLKQPIITRLDSALDRAYRRAFEAKGIFLHDSSSWYAEEMPLLEDLYRALRDDASDAAQLIAESIEPMVGAGTRAAGFNCRTSMDIREDPFVVFGLKGLDEQLLPIRVKQVQLFTWRQMLDGRLRRTVEVIDEAWFLMDSESSAKDLAERAKRFRKKNGSLIVATQQVSHFLANRQAKDVLDNAATHLLFKQPESMAGEVAALFGLNAAERNLLTLLPPQQFLLKLYGANLAPVTALHLHKPAPGTRYAAFTTRPDELLAIREQEAPDG